MNRRGFIFGLGAALVAAPAIVHATNLMQVKNFIIVPRKRKIVAELDQVTKTVKYRHTDGHEIRSWHQYILEDQDGQLKLDYHDVVRDYDPEQHPNTSRISILSKRSDYVREVYNFEEKRSELWPIETWYHEVDLTDDIRLCEKAFP